MLFKTEAQQHEEQMKRRVILQLEQVKLSVQRTRKGIGFYLENNLETKLQIDIAFGEIQERLDKIKEKIQNV